jgi:endonuclease/exonuclease/phosphatase family metal-dependent hydrolase
LINIHTDPDEVDEEINVLDDVLSAVRNDGLGEDDVILLGDLNASESQFGELGRVPNLAWVVHGEPTNTRQSRSYDNIVFSSIDTTEFTGRGGVLNLQDAYKLSPAAALRVSDHYPVWFELRVTEDVHGTRTAAAPNAVNR